MSADNKADGTVDFRDLLILLGSYGRYGVRHRQPVGAAQGRHARSIPP